MEVGSPAPETAPERYAPVSVYLAARYSRKAELRGYRDQLEARGYTVVSTWLDIDHATDPVAAANERRSADAPDEGPPESARAYAHQDVEDVQAADILVLFAEPVGAPPSLVDRGLIDAQPSRHSPATVAVTAAGRAELERIQRARCTGADA